MYEKYITLSLVALLWSTCIRAQETNPQDSSRQTPKDTIMQLGERNGLEKNWSQLFWTRPSMLFTRNLMGEECGVYTASNGFVANAGVMMLRGLTTVNLDASPYILVGGLPV